MIRILTGYHKNGTFSTTEEFTDNFPPGFKCYEPITAAATFLGLSAAEWGAAGAAMGGAGQLTGAVGGLFQGEPEPYEDPLKGQQAKTEEMRRERTYIAGEQAAPYVGKWPIATKAAAAYDIAESLKKGDKPSKESVYAFWQPPGKTQTFYDLTGFVNKSTRRMLVATAAVTPFAIKLGLEIGKEFLKTPTSKVISGGGGPLTKMARAGASERLGGGGGKRVAQGLSNLMERRG